MKFMLNCDYYYHYFGEDLMVIGKYGQYLLNEYQALVLKQINETGSVESLIGYFSDIAGECETKIKKLLLDTLKLFLKKEFIVKGVSVYPKHIYGEVGKFYPRKIVIGLTNKCHLQCTHCFKEAGPINRNFLKYEELINFLDRVKGKVYEIQLTGGEPMAHPHFKEISKYATENFQEVTMTTTGHLINSKSIIYLKGMSYIQISLYHHNPILNDQITNGKDTLNKTIRGIRFLNNENLDYSVTNIVRNSLIDEFDNFIEFLILNQVKAVRFGLFSHLGRGKLVGSDWFLSPSKVEEFYEMLIEKSREYGSRINIHTWEEDNCFNYFEDIVDGTMRCGAGVIEWTINESGHIKPCTFFPDGEFSSYSLQNFEEYSMQNHEQNIVRKINDWEGLLQTVGLSTRNICEEIYKMVEKK